MNKILTFTENKVANLAIKGLSNKDIAKKLCITIHTVKFHLSNIYRKLNVSNKVQLTLKIMNDSNNQN